MVRFSIRLPRTRLPWTGSLPTPSAIVVGSTAARSCPSISTRPESGATSPWITRSSVLRPQPFMPRTPMQLPASISSETLSSTGRPSWPSTRTP